MVGVRALLCSSPGHELREWRSISHGRDLKDFNTCTIRSTFSTLRISQSHPNSVANDSLPSDGSGRNDSLLEIARDATAATIEQERAASDLLEKFRYVAGQRTTESTKDDTPGLELSEAFLRKLALCQDLVEMLTILGQDEVSQDSKVLKTQTCCKLVELSAALGNSGLAFVIVEAMRGSSFQQPLDSNPGNRELLEWRFAPITVQVYASLVRGLSASLRVSDAVDVIERLRRRGLPLGDEVPFGKVVDCPTCFRSLAVVQPQNGVQIAACSVCRYQYEIMSGDVVKCDSEALSGQPSLIDRSLRLLGVRGDATPSAVHSVVVQSPDGVARTHRFATATPVVPAQPGERVSVTSAAPLSAKRRRALGLFSASTRVPGKRPGEPMSLTNHVTGEVSPLLRAAPAASEAGAGAAGSWLLPAAILLGSSDAAAGLIDPSLPALLALAAGTSLAAGAAANSLVLPKLNQLPERTVEAVSVKQKLLEQHSKLEGRLDQLLQAAANEVRMLARMWQLQNKMEAVGEPSTYSARIERVREARQGLDERLTAKLELIDSYSKVASMIEIEVEMSSDLLAAEAASATESIVEQIVKLEEVERLQTEWRQQAEASDEVERLLRSAPPLQQE